MDLNFLDGAMSGHAVNINTSNMMSETPVNKGPFIYMCVSEQKLLSPNVPENHVSENSQPP